MTSVETPKQRTVSQRTPRGAAVDRRATIIHQPAAGAGGTVASRNVAGCQGPTNTKGIAVNTSATEDRGLDWANGAATIGGCQKSTNQQEQMGGSHLYETT